MSAQEHLGSQFRIVHGQAAEGEGDFQGRITAYHGEHEAGWLDYHVNSHFFDRPAVYPDQVEVNEPYRKQGLATRMYDVVRERHPDLPIMHDPEAMSNSAKHVINKLAVRNPGVHLRWNDRRQASGPWEPVAKYRVTS